MEELDNRFFEPFHNLLEEHIKSKNVIQKIYNTVRDICYENDYFWIEECTNEYNKDDIENLKKQVEYYKSLSELI